MNKTLRILAGAIVAVTTLATSATAFANYYPLDRPTYTCTTPTNCKGADHVVFDSFTNNPVVGDERPFLAGSLNGANVQDRIHVKDGDQVVVRAFVHNNADASLMGGEDKTVAKNVKFRLLVPTASQKDTNMIGFITADNASPAMINDTMSVYGDSNFTLEYVKGSAVFEHAADGVHQTSDKLSDSIVTSAGAPLGDINGCFAYSGYVVLTVKVHMPTTPPTTPTYSCDLLHVVADNDTRKVTIDKFQTSQANGAAFKNVVVDWGDKTAANTYTNAINQMHTYAQNGTYTITALAHFTENGSGDYSATSEKCKQTVTFNSTTPPTTPPQTPTELPNTGAGNVIGIVAAAMAAGTIGYRLFLSRKLARR